MILGILHSFYLFQIYPNVMMIYIIDIVVYMHHIFLTLTKGGRGGSLIGWCFFFKNKLQPY
jgi:hypothetical protein